MEGEIPEATAPTTAKVPPGKTFVTPEVNMPATPAGGEVSEAMAPVTTEPPPGEANARAVLTEVITLVGDHPSC